MSSGSQVHSRIIAESARAVLEPLGLTQKGRSRMWLDDHHWWLGFVYFAPSGFFRYATLDVGCTWLWKVKEHITFDEITDRVSAGVAFKNEKQFALAMKPIVQRAVVELMRYRKRYPNIQAAARFTLRRRQPTFNQSYHGAIACGLTGRKKEAHRLFQRVLEASNPYGSKWIRHIKNDVRQMDRTADDTMNFRALITSRIHKTRRLMKLPALKEISFD